MVASTKLPFLIYIYLPLLLNQIKTAINNNIPGYPHIKAIRTPFMARWLK
jgi:hypothetical protein